MLCYNSVTKDLSELNILSHNQCVSGVNYAVSITLNAQKQFFYGAKNVIKMFCIKDMNPCYFLTLSSILRMPSFRMQQQCKRKNGEAVVLVSPDL